MCAISDYARSYLHQNFGSSTS